MKITDLHEDIAYASQKMDVVNGSLQSSIHLLSRFESAFVLSSIFPFFASLHPSSSKSGSKTETFEHVNIPDATVFMEQINFHMLLEKKGKIKLVRTSDDIDEPGVKLLLAMEGSDILRLPEDIFTLYSMGIRSIGLSWNYDNKFAASYLSTKDYGLTGSGQTLVSFCKDLGVAVDLSHASMRTIKDVLAMEHGPIFISHGNADAVFHHPRNYPDQIIREVAAEGGIIGVTGIRTTLGFQQDFEAYLNHLKHMGEVAGWDHVAVGSDLLGVDNPVTGLEDISKFGKLEGSLGNRSDDVLWRNGVNFFRKIL